MLMIVVVVLTPDPHQNIIDFYEGSYFEAKGALKALPTKGTKLKHLGGGRLFAAFFVLVARVDVFLPTEIVRRC